MLFAVLRPTLTWLQTHSDGFYTGIYRIEDIHKTTKLFIDILYDDYEHYKTIGHIDANSREYRFYSRVCSQNMH
jgi:hypothetical protein